MPKNAGSDELSDKELTEVTGGMKQIWETPCGNCGSLEWGIAWAGENPVYVECQVCGYESYLR